MSVPFRSVLLFILILIPASGWTAGDLDSGFGTGGVVITDLGGNENVTDVTTDSSGRVLVGGSNNNGMFIVRYKTNGEPDSGFGGGDGILQKQIGDMPRAPQQMIVQEDGKILVLLNIYFNASGNVTALVRFNTDGSLDNKFGNEGIAKTNGPGFFTGGTNAGLATQKDGKIIVAGMRVQADGSRNQAIIRYHSNGRIDTSFGNEGLLTTPVLPNRPFLTSLALNEKGEIFGMGRRNKSDPDQSVAHFVVKYDSEGIVDTSFGVNGVLEDSRNLNFDNPRLTLLPDGKILTNLSSFFFRYDARGEQDDSFGTEGKASIPSVAGNTLAIGPSSRIVYRNGKILFASWVVTPQTAEAPATTGFAAVRLKDDGSADDTFGGNGGAPGRAETAKRRDVTPVEGRTATLAVDPDGNIIVAGTGGRNIHLARFTDSRADPSIIVDDHEKKQEKKPEEKQDPKPEGSDLTVEIETPGEPLMLGKQETLKVSLVNKGSSDSTGTTFKGILPQYLEFISATSCKGECRFEEADVRLVSCPLGTLKAGERCEIKMTVHPVSEGTFEVSGSASSDTMDLNNEDNLQRLVLVIASLYAEHTEPLDTTKTEDPEPSTEKVPTTAAVNPAPANPAPAETKATSCTLIR